MFERIVLLTDLTSVTREAYAPVARIASTFQSKVFIFHAVRGSSELFYLEGEAAKLRNLIDDADRDRAMPSLLEAQGALKDAGVEAEIVTRVGSFFDITGDVLRELDADLCVIPTQGLHEFTGRVLGSTVARVIRDTSIPVLTVNENCGHRAEPWSDFRRIVHPVDLEGTTPESLRAAEDFAAELGGVLDVVHVIEPIKEQILRTPEGEILLPKDLRYQIRAKLQARLSDIAHTVQRVPARWQLVEDNKPGSGVMTYADQQGVDLIVLPSIGRDMTKNTLLGSVAEHVIKNARCPVLTIKHGWRANSE